MKEKAIKFISAIISYPLDLILCLYDVLYLKWINWKLKKCPPVKFVYKETEEEKLKTLYCENPILWMQEIKKKKEGIRCSHY